MKAYLLKTDGTVEEVPQCVGRIENVFTEIERAIGAQFDKLEVLALKSYGSTELWHRPYLTNPKNVNASNMAWPAWGADVNGPAVLRVPKGRAYVLSATPGRDEPYWHIAVEYPKPKTWPGEAGGGVVETKLPRRKASVRGSGAWADAHPAKDKLKTIMREVWQAVAPDLGDIPPGHAVDVIIDKVGGMRVSERLTLEEKQRGVTSVTKGQAGELLDVAPKTWLRDLAKGVL